MSHPFERLRRPTARPRLQVRRHLPGLLLALAAWAAPLEAQVAERAQPGQRVRVSLECAAAPAPSAGADACLGDGRETGVLRRLGPDELVLEEGGSLTTYSVASITRLEASAGSTSRWKAGGLIGFVAGTALTFAVLNSGSPDSTNPCDPGDNQDAIGGPGTCLLIAGVAGGVPGGLIGMFVGSRFRRERWVEVPLGAVGLRILPGGPRPSAAVSIPVR